MTVFSACFAYFLALSRHTHTPMNERLVIGSMTLALVCIYIRSVYRTVELFQGWAGFLITHEKFFIALDAAVIVIAAWSLNFFDPALLLNEDDKEVLLQRDGGVASQNSTEIEEHIVEVGTEK